MTFRLFTFLILLSPLCWAQVDIGYRTLVSDSFANSSQIFDLSKTLLWGSNSVATSAFQLTEKADARGKTYACISPSDSSLVHGSSFTADNSLKTSTCFDYRLPALNRENDSIKVEFDALWDTLSQIGEAGRMVMAFLYDYPSEIPFNAVNQVNEEAPFGRPAYNIRILNKALNASPTARTAYLFYGGGLDSLGEFELYSQNNVKQWWLPGFIAQPGGQSPQTGPAYPSGPTTREFAFLASSSEWRHFTFKLFPEKMELWMRKSDTTAQANRRIMVMHVPKTSPGRAYTISRINQLYGSNISNLPLYYRWFPQIDAVRFYFRSSNRSYLANVKIGYSGTKTAISTATTKGENLVYPNPNQEGKLWVKDTRMHTFTLIDTKGKTQREGFIFDNQIPLHGVGSGLYLLHLSDKLGHTKTQKLVIAP